MFSTLFYVLQSWGTDQEKFLGNQDLLKLAIVFLFSKP